MLELRSRFRALLKREYPHSLWTCSAYIELCISTSDYICARWFPGFEQYWVFGALHSQSSHLKLVAGLGRITRQFYRPM